MALSQTSQFTFQGAMYMGIICLSCQYCYQNQELDRFGWPPQHNVAALNEKKCPLVTADIEFDDSSTSSRKIAEINLFFGFFVCFF